jgi:hypothetical protein
MRFEARAQSNDLSFATVAVDGNEARISSQALKLSSFERTKRSGLGQMAGLTLELVLVIAFVAGCQQARQNRADALRASAACGVPPSEKPAFGK